MSQYVLNELENVLTYQTLRPLTNNEKLSDTEKIKRMTFDTKIKLKLGDLQEPPPTPLIYSEAKDNFISVDVNEQFKADEKD